MTEDRGDAGESSATGPSRSRSDITVTLACNNQCRFCPRSTLRHIRVRSAEQLDARLRDVRQQSHRVVLTGGEVTLLPDFVELVARCRALGFAQIGIITNGRRLADGALARRAVEAGLTEVCVTVYDHRAAVHDGLTRTPGSWAETLQGLTNVLALATDHPALLVRVNTLLSSTNADGMRPLLRRLHDLGIQRFLIGDVLLCESFPDALPLERVGEVMASVAADPRLADVAISWRGFPLCSARELPGVRIEPHDVDTALVDRGDLDAYFAEFHGLFRQVEACRRCAAAGCCLGLQQRYLEQHGSGQVAALSQAELERVVASATGTGEPGPAVSGSTHSGETAPLEAARRELADFDPWPESGRLEVMPTAACPFRCHYCNVELGRRHAAPDVLDRSVDLLLRSSRRELELQFYGGEPLVRRGEVLRTMARARALAEQAGKRLRFVITTSGLTLDPALLAILRGFDVKVMMSVDGPRELMRRVRPLGRSTRDVTAVIEEHLRLLCGSGVPYFVNMVVTPPDAAQVPARLAYLASLGARTVQICYALGPGWSEAAQQQFCDSLRQCAAWLDSPAGKGVRLQNLGSAAEPTVLSTDMIVDVDGTVYGDAALFAEKVFPRLRRRFRIGQVGQLASFDGLRRSREQNLVDLRDTYPDPQSPPRRVLEEQLAFARLVQGTVRSLAGRSSDPGETPDRSVGLGRPPTGPSSPVSTPDDNPLQRTVLRRSLAHQARVLRRRPELLPLPILMLENECLHDCVFCLAKPLDPTPYDPVARWLADNRSLGLTRLGVAGNEPLAHPEIDRILEQARRCGFERFEVLTSGVPLADGARARDLFEWGVRGFAIPLYADEPAIHDAITQSPGSHAETVRGIENLRALGADVHVHTNVVQQNLASLGALARRVQQAWGLPFCALPIRPKSAHRPYAELVPRYAQLRDWANPAYWVGFPLCVVKRLQRPALAPAHIIADVLKVYVLDQPFVKPPKCAPCRWNRRCSGTFAAYLELYGDEELEPVLD